MNGSYLHKLLVQAGRRVPAIARLQDDRNKLSEKVENLQRELSSQVIARNLLKTEIQRLVDDSGNMSPPQTEGFMVKFDYPYSPRVRSWKDARGDSVWAKLLASGMDRYRHNLLSFLQYKNSFLAISGDEPGDEREPYWTNPWLPSLDAICLSGLMTTINPRMYVEIGSGNSTKFVRRTISDHGLRTRVISIDPQPRAVVDVLCDEVIRDKLENCDLEIFADLGSEDILFVDNSHRSFQNSDVTVFFTEILPRLKTGCHYGIHDIFLPNDYPSEWLLRYYNEQYLLMAYLLGGAGGDEIVLPVHFVQQTPELLGLLDPIMRNPALQGALPVGGAFWMRKA